MNARMIVPAVLAAVMLGTPVMAANYSTTAAPAQATQKAADMTPVQKCSALEKQFDAAIKTHSKVAKVSEAKTMRADGGKLCASGKQADGIVKLDQALKDLGVTPKA